MLPHRSTSSQRTDFVLPMDNPEAGLRPLGSEPSFNTAVKETQSNMPHPLREAVPNENAEIAQGTVPAQGEDVIENPRRDVEDHPEEKRVGDRLKDNVKQLVMGELATLVEKLLVDIHRTSNHSAQSGTRSVVHNVAEQVMSDLFSKDVIGKTLKAHIPKLF